MAHYDLEEQEQIDAIKTWWKMHGDRLTGALLLMAIALVAWQGWNWYQGTQSNQAASVYAALEKAIDGKDVQGITTLTGELTGKFPHTTYAGIAALQAAKEAVERGDAQTARALFAWAAENAKDEWRDLARLRLSAVLLDDKAYDEALSTLQKPPALAFMMVFNERRGDILFAAGKKEEARAAWQLALDATPLMLKKAESDEGFSFKNLLQQKLDALGGPSSTVKEDTKPADQKGA